MFRLTMSGFSRAKMAKVDSLSHTHLVLNESTSTALQPLADQDPSREELHGRKTHTHTHTRTPTQTDTHTHTHAERERERRRRSDAVNIETAPAKRKRKRFKSHRVAPAI